MDGFARFVGWLEWFMTGLLTIVGGLELWQNPLLGVLHLGFAILLCPKTQIHWTYKAILALLALASTFL
ncbi:MAG: hypothetical protein KME12_18015 [Trichocoleus desertorum ATA4-8-CV12]|jgi:hypothetical protein|nr:hypothetical protein [Trichocoleus desertorum ATA4-8-CV12]